MNDQLNQSLSRTFDQICDAFEDQWSAQARNLIDDWLGKVDPAHRERLMEMLLEIDLELRLKSGDHVRTDDYQNLGNHAVSFVGHFLECHNSRGKSITLPGAGELVESNQIGPYKLIQQIGEGGMGSVWMAKQLKPFRRRVALKVIKAGMDTDQVIARFEAERQALAMMDHQNIAKVLDAGVTKDGRPYFAMELVQGIPITQYCDQNKLSLNDRLELFLPVCKAIQHAHQKGIIHRDVKPSNVMVTLYDGSPVPKVIDFGLAKALQHQTRLTDKTMFTEFGQVVGTLQYMSPEQAEMNALDVDTRTDVYSLGVMLYELLTDSTPLDKQTLIETPFLEILREIKEREPPRPSTRLSSCGDQIKRISDQRKIDPRKLQQVLRGELDWIVMKALEKDRTRRYETANGLAEDISRYLNREPVTARPPTTAYRLRKFVGKNKLVAGSTVCVILVMLIAIILIAGFWAAANDARRMAKAGERGAKLDRIRAEDARDLADQLRIRANQKAREAEAATNLAREETAVAVEVQRFLQDAFLKKTSIWEQANSQISVTSKNIRQDVTVRELLDDAAREYSPATIQDRFPDKPLVQAEILETIGEAYSAVEQHDTAVAYMSAANDIRNTAFGEQSPRTAQGRVSLLFVLISAGKYAEAIQILEKVVDAFHGPYMAAIKASKNGESESVIQQHLRLAEQLTDATIDALEDRIHPRRLVLPSYAGNISNFPSVMLNMASIIQKFHDLHEDFRVRYDASNRRRAAAQLCLGLTLFAAGDRDKAVDAIEQSLAWVNREYGADDPRSAGVAVILALAYENAGRKWDDIIPLLEHGYQTLSESLGREHPTTIITGLNLASAYENNDQLAKSVPIREEIVFIRLRQLGLDHANAFDSVEAITIDYRALGNTKKALEIAERFFNETRNSLTARHYVTLQAMEDYAYCLNADGQRERGDSVYQELIELCQTEFGDKDEKTLHFTDMFADSLYAMDEYERALPLFEKVLADRVEVLGPLDPGTLDTLEYLAKSFRELHQYDEAINRFQQLVDANLENLGPRNVDTILSQAMLAECLARGGRTDDAIKQFETLVKRVNRQWGETDSRSMNYLSRLASLWTDKGEFETAVAMRRTLVERERQLANNESARSPFQLSKQLFELAVALKLSGDLDGAVNACTECVEIRQKNWPKQRILFEAQSLLGECRCLAGQFETGELLLTEAFSELQLLNQQADDEANHIALRETARRLVEACHQANRPAEAEKWQAELHLLDTLQPSDN